MSPRQRGVRQGAVLLFVSLLVGFVMALLSVFVLGRPELYVTTAAGVFLLSGVLRIVYAHMFERTAPGGVSKSARLGGSARGGALPPAQSIPVAGSGARRVNTAEMVARPSVTEHTTKLLGKE